MNIKLLIVCGAVVSAVSTPLVRAADAKPEQVRLQLQGGSTPGGSTGRVVSWVTRVSTATSIVRYGTSAGVLDNTATGAANTRFDAGSGNTQYLHNVVLPTEQLKADTAYFYAVGDATGGWSDTFSFNTSTPKVWAVYGDFGYINDESLTALLAEAETGGFDAVFHVGDFAYDLDSTEGAMGDSFLNAIQPFAAQKPYQTTPGNHEQANNFTHYKHRFAGVAMGTGAASGSGTNLWHSFDAGLVHFIGIDTEVYSFFRDPGQVDRMLNWIEADLIKANANRDQVPWIVMGGHKSSWMANFSAIEPLIHKYGVDLYVCGHVHNYLRAFPQYNGSIWYPPAGSDNHTYEDPEYYTTLVAGSPGCQEKIAPQTGPYPLAAQSLSYGFGHLEAVNATHLHWMWKQTAAPGEVGTTTEDELWLVVHNHGPRE